jgi:hypothetical protein
MRVGHLDEEFELLVGHIDPPADRGLTDSPVQGDQRRPLRDLPSLKSCRFDSDRTGGIRWRCIRSRCTVHRRPL